jgi:hypothetical protein
MLMLDWDYFYGRFFLNGRPRLYTGIPPNHINFRRRHDRTFLNAVATDIIHLSQQRLVTYAGNYENYIKVRVSRHPQACALFSLSRAFPCTAPRSG